MNTLLTTQQQLDVLNRGTVLASLGKANSNAPAGGQLNALAGAYPYAMQVVEIRWSYIGAGAIVNPVDGEVFLDGVSLGTWQVPAAAASGATGVVTVDAFMFNPGATLHTDVGGGSGNPAGIIAVTVGLVPA